jgi:hypothetical protein
MRTILMASVAAASLVLLASAGSAAPVTPLTGQNATPLVHPVQYGGGGGYGGGYYCHRHYVCEGYGYYRHCHWVCD